MNREPRSCHKVDPLESQSGPDVIESDPLGGAAGDEWLYAIGIHFEDMTSIEWNQRWVEGGANLAMLVNNAERNPSMGVFQFHTQDRSSYRIEWAFAVQVEHGEGLGTKIEQMFVGLIGLFHRALRIFLQELVEENFSERLGGVSTSRTTGGTDLFAVGMENRTVVMLEPIEPREGVDSCRG